MITNGDITIYNREYNPQTRLDIWHRTVIKNVWRHADNKVAQTDSGLKSSDAFKIRIPKASPDKPYLDPESYAAVENKDKYWTIQEDDIVVLSACKQDISKPSDLKEKHIRYAKIVSWSNNDVGSQPHWRIGGI